MKALRAILGFLTGSALSVGALYLWFYSVTHHDPSQPASLRYMAASAAVAVLFGVIGGYIATVIAPLSAQNLGMWIAGFIVLLAVWSVWETWRDHFAIWSEVVAIVFMAPSVLFGAHLRPGHADHSHRHLAATK